MSLPSDEIIYETLAPSLCLWLCCLNHHWKLSNKTSGTAEHCNLVSHLCFTHACCHQLIVTGGHLFVCYSKRRAGKARAIGTPDPVEGRRHMDIQTDVYLEELTDTVPEVDTTTQTCPFLDRPSSPMFVPQKSGVDATTQIEQGGLSACMHHPRVSQILQQRLHCRACVKAA